MSIWLTYTCPVELCSEVELEGEWEGADPEVGLREGVLPPDTPSSCPECKTEYTTDQIQAITAELEKAASDWEPPEPDLDYGL